MKRIIAVLILALCMMTLTGFAETTDQKTINIELGQLSVSDKTCAISFESDQETSLLNAYVKLFTTGKKRTCVANGIVRYNGQYDLFYMDFEMTDGQNVYVTQDYDIEFTNRTDKINYTKYKGGNQDITLEKVSNTLIDKSISHPEQVTIKLIGTNLNKAKTIKLINAENKTIKSWTSTDLYRKNDSLRSKDLGYGSIELYIAKSLMTIGSYTVTVSDGEKTATIGNIERNYTIESSKLYYAPGDQLGNIQIKIKGLAVMSPISYKLYEYDEDHYWGKSIIDTVENPEITYMTDKKEILININPKLKEGYNENKGLMKDSRYVVEVKKGTFVFRYTINVTEEPVYQIETQQFHESKATIESEVQITSPKNIPETKVKLINEATQLSIGTGSIRYNEAANKYILVVEILKDRHLVAGDRYTIKGIGKELIGKNGDSLTITATNTKSVTIEKGKDVRLMDQKIYSLYTLRCIGFEPDDFIALKCNKRLYNIASNAGYVEIETYTMVKDSKTEKVVSLYIGKNMNHLLKQIQYKNSSNEIISETL